ncbi:MAG: ABC transporter permease [Terriglobales bacterium]|jgi:ABC-2 type transport system permease protein
MFRRIFAQARKELTQITRDRLALTLALILPLLLLILLSNAISLTVNDLPLIVQDLDGSPASRSYIDAFRASITFRVVSWPADRQPEEALKAGAARGVLVIPVHFGRDLARGQAADAQLLIDATDANTAKLVSGYAGQITRAFNEQNTGTGIPAMVNPQIRLWFNPGRVSTKFYAPGIFVLGISMFPPLLASLAMSKEGEQKTILQVYVSSISAHEFLLGKILAFMIIALAEWLLALIVLITVFGLRLTGDPTALIVSTILYAFCVSAFGTMVGAVIPNQAAAIQAVALGGFLLVFLLSGLIFPVENIPVGLRWVSNIVWGRYYMAIVRDALLQGGGWPAMWFNVLMIGLIGSVFYFMAWRIMRPMQVSA